MNTLSPAWYMDIRKAETSEHMSLDLTRHLPRRLMVGTAIIVSDRPDILLPVIRKRWMRVIREVQRQLSSTLDRAKKHELTRGRTSAQFSVHHPDRQTRYRRTAHRTIPDRMPLTRIYQLVYPNAANNRPVPVGYRTCSTKHHGCRLRRAYPV
jgi:hypothetical protein